MIENVTLLAAFGAGLLSFISPCVLPLIPGYLSYISGLSLDEMRGTGTAAVATPAVRNRVLLSSLAFIIGFSLVFVALGASASAIGQFLMSRLTILGRVAGATVYPTVLNTRTGNFGVLTGTLVVKPKSMADAEAIANSHGLEKAKEYPHLQTVFYRVKANMDVADVAAALQADARIESAYPEIIEYVRTPK